jgi:4-hydroxybenzoate polyprenyltransferase
MATHPELARPAASPAERLRTYASFVRFEHTLFSLPLILAGVFSAPGPALSLARWVLLVVAAVGARTAALSLNRLIDRRLDALNPRTQGRELPAGRMKLVEAWTLLIVSTVAYLVACALLGPWFLRVAIVPLLVFTLYPYLKRFTPLCHVGVGLALALAPLAGYAAAHPDLSYPWPAVWLALFALVWVTGFDIIYATLDESFDRSHHVHSAVAWLGRTRALGVSAALHAIAFLCLACAAGAVLILQVRPPGWVVPATFAALVATGLLLWLEQQKADDVNLAFFKVNVVVGFAVLATILLARAGTF